MDRRTKFNLTSYIERKKEMQQYQCLSAFIIWFGLKKYQEISFFFFLLSLNGTFLQLESVVSEQHPIYMVRENFWILQFLLLVIYFI